MARWDHGQAVRAIASEAEEGQRACARGDWCSGRNISTGGKGERVITPAHTWRTYCDKCETYLGALLRYDPQRRDDLGSLYERMAAALGDPLQAEVQIHMPFGPQLPLREDIDAHMRLTAVILAGWEARVRAVQKLSRTDLDRRPGSLESVRQSARTLADHMSTLLALQPGWMTRTFRWPLDAETAAWLADAELVRVGIDYVDIMTEVGAEDAGREIQYLHYRARSLLLETNPPPEILIPNCRQCGRRALRRAWPDTDRDLYSRCDYCDDEMTGQEYQVNSVRWVAFHKAHAENRPVLAGAS